MKIKQQRKAFREKVKKQQARHASTTNKQDGKLQKKMTAKQVKRRETQIKRNIAKHKELKYQLNGGDIAFKHVKTNTND